MASRQDDHRHVNAIQFLGDDASHFSHTPLSSGLVSYVKHTRATARTPSRARPAQVWDSPLQVDQTGSETKGPSVKHRTTERQRVYLFIASLVQSKENGYGLISAAETLGASQSLCIRVRHCNSVHVVFIGKAALSPSQRARVGKLAVASQPSRASHLLLAAPFSGNKFQHLLFDEQLLDE